MIAQLSIRLGISPRELLDSPTTVIDEMVRLLVEMDEKAAK